MCTFCTNFGHGDRWYFNLENYLFDRIFPTEEGKETAKRKSLRALADTDRYGDPEYVHDTAYLWKKYEEMPGQIITLEEANRVIELADEAMKRQDTIVVLSRCNCALSYRGKMEYRCIVFGIPVAWSSEIGYARYPKEGLTELGGGQWQEVREQIRKEQRVPLKTDEAKELLEEWDKKGLHHTLVSRGFLPMIDGMCNCEAPYCMRVRDLRVKNIYKNVLERGHFVARIDPEACTACGACVERCEFGAIRISQWSHITLVDPALCFGCGLCRVACRPQAITMIPRERIPAALGLAQRPTLSPSGERSAQIASARPVEIAIDRSQCRFSLFDPSGCKKCLEVCPAVVFGTTPAQPRQAGMAPTVYKLTVPYQELCIGCGACQKTCPANAITIKMG